MSRMILTDSQLDERTRDALSDGKRLTVNALMAIIGCSRRRATEAAERIGARFDRHCKFSLSSEDVARLALKDKKKISAIVKATSDAPKEAHIGTAPKSRPPIEQVACSPSICTGCRGVIVITPCILCTLNGKTGMRYCSAVRNTYSSSQAELPARGTFRIGDRNGRGSRD